MKKLWVLYLFTLVYFFGMHAANNEFSVLTWKFDMPAELEDYNIVYENRAKAGLKEINLYSDADIVCLQGLALSMQDVAMLLSCYNIISYANGCCILIKKYAKHFLPLYKTAFLHGASVFLQAQDASDIKLHICSIDCHEKTNHEGCIILREEKPTLYVGTGIYTHPIFAKMKLFGTVESQEQLQGVALDVDAAKQIPVDVIVKKGINHAAKIPDKSISSTQPLYISVIWNGFQRIAPENQSYTAFSSGQRIALKAERAHIHDVGEDQDLHNVRLPFGIPLQACAQPISKMNKEFVLGKSIETHAPKHLRRLNQDNEFNVLFWNLGNPEATQADKDQALIELTYAGADIVGLQGIQGINIEMLLPYYTLVKRNEKGAILINKHSSLLAGEPQEITAFKGLSCNIYDAEYPQDEIMIYCLDFKDDAMLYTHNLRIRPYNTIIMGNNLHANKVSFSECLKDHSLYHVLGDQHNQILATAFPHAIQMLAGIAEWQGITWNLYSGVGLITKYGHITHTKTIAKPLFATLRWKGIVRYKMDVPHQKISSAKKPEIKGKSD